MTAAEEESEAVDDEEDDEDEEEEDDTSKNRCAPWHTWSHELILPRQTWSYLLPRLPLTELLLLQALRVPLERLELLLLLPLLLLLWLLPLLLLWLLRVALVAAGVEEGTKTKRSVLPSGVAGSCAPQSDTRGSCAVLMARAQYSQHTGPIVSLTHVERHSGRATEI